MCPWSTSCAMRRASSCSEAPPRFMPSTGHASLRPACTISAVSRLLTRHTSQRLHGTIAWHERSRGGSSLWSLRFGALCSRRAARCDTWRERPSSQVPGGSVLSRPLRLTTCVDHSMPKLDHMHTPPRPAHFPGRSLLPAPRSAARPGPRLTAAPVPHALRSRQCFATSKHVRRFVGNTASSAVVAAGGARRRRRPTGRLQREAGSAVSE